ncbi:MAG: hypothetical protein QG620_831 [Patescibacteria group bacterium]|nr:hypothetical protein [Patescibacteria group bacterium]
MKVKDIMTKEVVSVSPETKVTEVAAIMSKNRFHGVPVVEKGKIVGIVTESDFFTKDSGNLYLPSYINFLESAKLAEDLPEEKKEKVGKLIDARALDIMKKECVTILQDMDVRDLLSFFRETKFNSLPVTDEDDNLVGIVTLADVLGMIKVTE